MDLPEIKALIDAMAASDLAEMEVAKDGWTLRLVRQQPGASAPLPPAERALEPRALEPAAPATPARSAPPEPMTDDTLVRAPMFGTVYLSPTPGEPAFVAIGEPVKAGATLCVIEAMKVFNTVRADRDGAVTAVLVASGDEVQAGQPLLRLE